MLKPFYTSLLVSSLLLAIGLGVAVPSYATVSIIHGKTIIPAGNATSDKDLTIRNEKLAFSLAVGSAPPWGVARGCIVDIANVTADGSLSNDRVAFADFIPNNWSSWPTTYQTVDIIKDSQDEAIVKVTRDFGKVVISTLYSLASGSDRIHVKTTMTNEGEALVDMLSGYTLWPDAGFKFAVPGYAGKDQAVIHNPISDRFVGYDADWAIALHAPYMTELKSKSRDLYTKHTLKKSETMSFEGDYQVLASGDISPVVRAEIERKNLQSGTLTGSVKTQQDKFVNQPAVVVLKEGVPYIWVIGENGQYHLDLPVGDYQVYAAGKGYSDSTKHDISIQHNVSQTLSFGDLMAPGEVNIQVTDAQTTSALDAKIQIEKGNTPLIEFFGATTFFTELVPVGHAKFTLAPGDYQLKISAGGGFVAKPVLIDASIIPNKTTSLVSAIPVSTYPTQQGWYAGDLHHHADVLEGSTSAEYLVRSQLAAGLNVTFVSDHDSTKNHEAIKKLSDKRGVPFIPSIEISPSWGHFNVFPVEIGAQLAVDPGVDDIHSIIQDARRIGATVVASNHPYIPYGYLSSLEKNTAPGGFDPSIDLIEINSEVDYMQAVEKARQLWSEGLPYYYTAGSDTHDVWNETSGHNRMFVYTASKPNAKAFAQAMKNGRSYASFGPVIYPKNVMFGDTLKLAANQSQSIRFDLLSVNGLKSVQLIGNDGVISEQTLSGDKVSVAFEVPQTSGWVSLVVEDTKTHKAFSNPIWLKMVDKNIF
ncbi:CehA/McbA family metallohydrolase [Paraglaciecola sp. MB-3u-78]|uniref:CehA/McbA family metallohydrolase n=1 Tax=Paraglaciecola sp. MB-3u-78 TaxID=2058332 RepID=UPI000C343F7D|nr:CehA/McbA family metallohydrolase [Paraglaciecola sp. MB-3u-78]PKG97244.1 TonB-dependent receptor [Paraglaciecola sp. MB-3u-78]